ncbi:MAG: serine hydrolase domain-containing protein [Flammeovirgaceae bacterium]
MSTLIVNLQRGLYCSSLVILLLLVYEPSIHAQLKTASGKTLQTDEVDAFIREQMQKHRIPGLSLAIINRAKLVYHQTYGVQNTQTQAAVNRSTIFEAASMSKSVFAYFTMKMVDQGLLSLDTPLYRYMPHKDIEHDERYKLITARMVLAHTSGFPNWRFHNEDGKLDIKFKPGTQFYYSGEGYEYLAKVLAHLLHTDFNGLEKVIAEQVYQPLNMRNSGFIMTDQLTEHKALGYEDGQYSDGLPADLIKPYFGASFGLHSEAVDFSKFMIALMKRKGLTKAAYKELYREQVVLPKEESLRTEDGFDSWGLGVIRATTPQGLKLTHGGMNPSFQCYYMILPSKKFGFVFFGNSNTAINMVKELEQYLLGD